MKSPFADKLIEQCADLKRFLSTGAKMKLGSIAGGTHMEKLDQLCNSLGNIPTRMGLWDAGMTSVLLCLDLEANGVMSYSVSLPAYKSYVQAQSKRRHDGTAVEASTEPYLQTVVSFCKKVNFLKRSAYPKYNKRIPGGTTTCLRACSSLRTATSGNGSWRPIASPRCMRR